MARIRVATWVLGGTVGVVFLLAALATGSVLAGCEEQAQSSGTHSSETQSSGPLSSGAAASTTAPYGGVSISTVPVEDSCSPSSEPISSSARSSAQRTITDMYGRELSVPAVVNRVLATGPVEMELVYLLAPDKLSGLSFEFSGNPPLVPEKYAKLPVVGGWFGTQTGNYETFLAVHPDLVLEGSKESLAERQQKLGEIPVVGVSSGDCLTQYEPALRFLGDLLGTTDSAENLISYYREAMSYVQGVVSQIPDSRKVKVYYAEGKDGLSTDPAGSWHSKLLDFCGGKNVAQLAAKPGYGMAETSLEQIMLWDPDLIIIGRGSQPALYKTIMTDPKWTKLRAVKNKQVFVRPDNPFSWFDGPPGPCQILGLYWMVSKLYPEATKDLRLTAKVKAFYSQFLHFDLTDNDVAKLLANPE